MERVGVTEDDVRGQGEMETNNLLWQTLKGSSDRRRKRRRLSTLLSAV